MRIVSTRDIFSAHSTTSTITVNGKLFGYALEDVDRRLEDGGIKVHGRTAIPRGTYVVLIDYSPLFNRDMPHLIGVPGYTGVRVHWGNDAEDTEGCLIVGSARKPDWVSNSRQTFAKLFALMEAAYERGEEITWTIQ